MTNEEFMEIWVLEDEYLDRIRYGETIDIEAYCDKPYLSPVERRKLREQLEEYKAIQEGIDRSVMSHFDLEALWTRIALSLPKRVINLADVLSLQERSQQNIREWLIRAYRHLTEEADKTVENLTLGKQVRKLRAHAFDASASKLPVDILDEEGNTKTVEFLLETDIELDSDGELVFSALAPDDSYIGKRISITIEDDERELHLCSPVVGVDRRIEVFLDLSPLGAGIQINRNMIKAQLVEG